MNFFHQTPTISLKTAMDLLKKLMAMDPRHRPTSKQALDHKFFSEFGKNLDEKNLGFTKISSGTSLGSTNTPPKELSKESLGSLSLVTRKPLLNGRTETIDKFSQNNLNSAGSIDIPGCLTPKTKQTSKFSSAAGAGNTIGGNSGEENWGVKKKAGFFQSDDLHKKAIINNLTKKEYEEEKK